MDLRLGLLLIDLMGLCLEGAAVLLTIYLLFGNHDVPVPGVLQLGRAALRPLWLVVLLVGALYALWLEGWLRRLHRASLRRGRGPVEEMYALAGALPRHALWVRTLLWTLCGALYLGWLVHLGLPPLGVLPVLWIFVLDPLLVGALHSLACDRLLWGAAWRPLSERPDDLRRFQGRFTMELGRATLLCTAPVLLCTAGFVPFNLEQFQRAERFLPALLLLLCGAGHRFGKLSARPIGAYLQARPGAARAAAAPAAYRAAHSLPYHLAGALVGASLVVSLALIAIFRPLLALPIESVLLVLGVSLSVSMAASIYALIWHRFTMRTLLAHLEEASPLPPAKVPPALPLATKMVISFGSPVLCVCLLSLLWSFAQYRTLANHHIQRLAGERLAGLLSALREAARTRPGLHADEAVAVLRAAAIPGAGEAQRALPAEGGGALAEPPLIEGYLVYYLPAGAEHAVAVAAPPGVTPLPLPPYPLSNLRLWDHGPIDVSQALLTGVYERAGPGLGSVAVLYPNYRHPGFAGRAGARAPLRGQLLGLVFFFAILIFVSGGIVVIAAVDLSRPVRYLERRVAAMAEGDLMLPVVQTAVEVDEVGRLTLAFEEMRLKLCDMLRSSTELNLQLEAEVARRTTELSRRNQEVSEAVDRLQRTRGELLRTEKLAIMGRIAAEITVEINNPVNVMATLPDPIGEALDELAGLGRAAPLDRPRIAATLAELRKMVDVLLRGAQRAKEIVRATRIYARLGDTTEGVFDLNQAVDEVLQLFAELPRYGVAMVRAYAGALRVRAVRGHVAQLLSGWLATTTPRLREAAPGQGTPQVRISITRQEGPRPFAELLVTDNGPPLSPPQLAALRDGGVAARFGADLRLRSEPGATSLRLRLQLPG